MCFNWCRCIDCVGLLALSIDNYLHKDPRRIPVASQNDPRGSLRQFMASPTFQKESHRVMKESLKKPQKIPENPKGIQGQVQGIPNHPKNPLNPQNYKIVSKNVKRIQKESQKDP